MSVLTCMVQFKETSLSRYRPALATTCSATFTRTITNYYGIDMFACHKARLDKWYSPQNSSP
jgi:hypothetical protein